MSILKSFGRFNPFRILRAPIAVPRLEAAAAKLRADQKAMSRQVRTLTRLVDRLQRTVQQQQAVAAGMPALQAALQQCEARIEQCIGVYTRDAMHADRLPRLRERLVSARAESHAAAAVQRAVLEMDPGAHIVIEDLLPEDLADELVAAVPPSLFFPNGNRKRQEIGVPFFFAPEYNRLVWGFFSDVLERAILPAVVEKFRPALDDFMRTNWPALGSFADSGIRLGVTNSRLMLRRPGYRIKPHRDPRWAFLTCLVYLQKRDDAHAYGTQFYRLREEREPAHHSPLWVDDDEVTLVKDVPARRNTAVVFLNSTGAHGAFIPPDAPPEMERFIYQVQFGPDVATRQMLVAALEGPARAGWTTARGASY
jgi:hypothetical protein